MPEAEVDGLDRLMGSPVRDSAGLVRIVDDDEDTRRIYSEILRWAGYRTLEAGDGVAGVEMAREHRPDLILMDISMPRLYGWGAIEMLKRDPATADFPALAITAHVSLAGQRERARAAGFEDYVVKPITPHDLLDAVRNSAG
jgi:CheY-like chemotaxis protein